MVQGAVNWSESEWNAVIYTESCVHYTASVTSNTLGLVVKQFNKFIIIILFLTLRSPIFTEFRICDCTKTWGKARINPGWA